MVWLNISWNVLLMCLIIFQKQDAYYADEINCNTFVYIDDFTLEFSHE